MIDGKSSQQKPVHEVFISTREKMNISGVKEILNFDDTSVNLKTVCGDLSIEGSDLHITVLNVERGEVEMNGKISSLYYYDNSEGDKRSLLSRIFR